MAEILRIFRFALVASLVAVVHLCIAEVLVLARWVDSVFVANLSAFGPAVVVSYLGQRNYAFRTSGSAARFGVMALTGFGLNNGALLGAVQLGVAPPLALLLSAMVSPVLMYLGCRQLVFAR